MNITISLAAEKISMNVSENMYLSNSYFSYY